MHNNNGDVCNINESFRIYLKVITASDRFVYYFFRDYDLNPIWSVGKLQNWLLFRLDKLLT